MDISNSSITIKAVHIFHGEFKAYILCPAGFYVKAYSFQTGKKKRLILETLRN